MIWLTWRQFRAQALVVFGALAVIAVLFAITRPSLINFYNTTVATCADRGDCDTVTSTLVNKHRILQMLSTGLVAVPGLLGIFWGAPLVARELETGTFRLAWTQSVTRTRWLAVKLAVVGAASMATAGLLSLLITWWASPLDKVHANRFAAGNFGERGIVPIGYAAFAFALGLTAGLLIRRTLPAMVTTMVAFLAVRVSWTLWVRSHLLTPAHLTSALQPDSIGFGSTSPSGPMTLQPNPPDIANAWIYTTHIVDSAGNALTSQALASACPGLGANLPTRPPGAGGVIRVVPDGARSAITDCVTKLSATYHQVVTYQPANRYWIFQWYETGLFLVASLLLAGFCFWWIRRRVN